MLSYEQIKLYLPKYLSPESSDELFEELKSYPNNLNKIYQSIESKKKILQGDGLDSLPIINLPDKTIANKPVMVISNSCDNDIDNERFYSPKICYCPLMTLKKYKENLIKFSKKFTEDSINNHIESIKKQLKSQIFYLPQGEGGLEEDHLIHFNTLISCDIKYIYKKLENMNFLFRLSNYGFYFFIIKLSIFMTRLNEEIDRKNS